MKNDSCENWASDDTTVATDMSFVHVNAEDEVVPALSVSVAPKHDFIGVDSNMSKTTACATIKAREFPADERNRAPLDIIIALDVSYSMNGSKLNLCKETLKPLVRALGPGDRFGLVTYSDEAILEIPAQKMTESAKKSCLEKIISLSPRNCTDISAGIGLACQEMRLIENPNEVRYIFLLTDGLANRGIRDSAELIEFTNCCFTDASQGQRKADDVSTQMPSPKDEDFMPKTVIAGPSTNIPINLCCFGYGSDHNSNLLEQMCSNTQGGSYYFVENDKNVGTAFGDALGGILSVVAQNVSVTINIPAEAKEIGVRIVEVWHDQKVKRENGSYTVLLGDFYAEESRDVLFEITLGPKEAVCASPAPISHATVSVSYTDTLRKTPCVSDDIACFIARPPGAEVSESNERVDCQWLRIETIKYIADANEKARNGDFSGSKEILKTAAGRLAGSGIQNDMTRQLEEELGGIQSGFASFSSYERRGAHDASNIVAMHRKQRCMVARRCSKSNIYQSKKKADMMDKLSFD